MKKEEKIIFCYSIECPECGKKISGYKPSQVNYNLKIHLEAKHGEEIK